MSDQSRWRKFSGSPRRAASPRSLMNFVTNLMCASKQTICMRSPLALLAEAGKKLPKISPALQRHLPKLPDGSAGGGWGGEREKGGRGEDAKMRAMAKGIIKAQQKEIKEFDQWLGKRK